MRNVLITGANRGLGLGFTQHYLNQGDQVWAGYRDDASTLTNLRNERCYPVQWDVTQPLAESQKSNLPEKIDILINNAGIYGDKGGQNLNNVSSDLLLEVFRVNAVAPIQVIQTVLTQLKKGKAIIANMSSKMGSVADNSSGGVYAYRASKAALCSISKSMAVDLQNDGIRVISLHPGWVQTDMTNQTGLIDVATSIAGLTAVIDNIDDFSPGAFVAYDGTTVPY